MRKVLIAILLVAVVAPQCLAAELPDAPSATAQAVRAQATKFANSQKNATIVLKDGSKVSGTVVRADETGFVVSESKTGQARTFAYGDVTQVKRKGLHPAAKVAIAAGGVILGGMIILASQMD